MSSTTIYTDLNLNISKFNLNDTSYYVYVYLDPFTEIPIYVGKGKNNRLYDHLNKTALSTNTKFYNKLNSILATGYYPIIYKIKENLNNFEALNLEHFFIEYFGVKTRFGGTLYNTTNGGRGGNTYYGATDESRIKRGKIQTQRNIERFSDPNERKNIGDKIKEYKKLNPDKASASVKLRTLNMRKNGTAKNCYKNISMGNRVNKLAKSIFKWINDIDCTVKIHNSKEFKLFLLNNRNTISTNIEIVDFKSFYEYTGKIFRWINVITKITSKYKPQYDEFIKINYNEL